MSRSTRRRFLGGASVSAAALAGWPHIVRSATRPAMRITEIETHSILVPFQDFNATTLSRYQGLNVQLRTIYVVKTDAGLEGYGESPGRGLPADEVAKYVGTSPFDWIGDRANLAINMAVYDLMGKALGVPVWKLLGPKVRSWVPVAAWTVSQPPDAMAEEVRQAARRGYRWLKYHVDELQNAVDQTAAMQEVAPTGFRIHYDFNADGNVEAVYPVLKELERFTVAGRIEDPIDTHDRDGYRLLREKCSLSILLHHAPPEAMVDRLCDGYMAGHSAIGHAEKVAAIAEATNTPFMLQQIGGTINQAFLAHEAAVFRMATLDHVNLCHLWKDDVTSETMPIVGSSVEVPRGPGLGVTLDRAKLERYENAPRPKQDRFLVRSRYANGLTVYYRFDPGGDVPILRLRLRGKLPGPLPGYANPVVTDFWDDTSDPAFERIWTQTETGPYREDRP